MMEWTLAILFLVALILLVASIIKNRQTIKAEQREIDMIHLTVTEEMNQLQKQIRNLELDLEITQNQAGIQFSSDKIILRQALDLYKRKYSIESIAAETKLTETEVQNMLSPYLVQKEERGVGTNEA